MNRFLPIALLITGILFSCTKGPDPDAVSLFLRQTEVGGDAGQVFVKVVSNAEWSLETDAPWAHFVDDDASGKGSCNSVRLAFEANDKDTVARVLTITAYVGDAAKATAVLGQRAKGREAPEDYSKDYIKAYTTDTWLELPQTFSSDGHSVISHKMVLSGKTERNYTYYWDYDNMVALWVAYPLNAGLIGTGSRTDAWGMENSDFIPTINQPILYKGYSSPDGARYDRGHQIPSADRLSRLANVQTFYGTNMTPQDNSFNTGIWGACEDKVRKWAKSCDTLYVVTGCVPEGSTRYALDNVGQRVTVPKAYFKACLCYFADSTVGHSGYFAVGFYFEHFGTRYSSFSRNLSCSIDELEAKLGYDLFVNLPGKVGGSVAAQIEAEDPYDISWWW